VQEKVNAADGASGLVIPSGTFYASTPVSVLVDVRQGAILPSTVPVDMKVLSKVEESFVFALLKFMNNDNLSQVVEISLDPPLPIFKDVTVVLEAYPSSLLGRRLLLLQQQQEGADYQVSFEPASCVFLKTNWLSCMGPTFSASLFRWRGSTNCRFHGCQSKIAAFLLPTTRLLRFWQVRQSRLL
jgi:hypothetical protein